MPYKIYCSQTWCYLIIFQLCTRNRNGNDEKNGNNISWRMNEYFVLSRWRELNLRFNAQGLRGKLPSRPNKKQSFLGSTYPHINEGLKMIRKLRRKIAFILNLYRIQLSEESNWELSLKWLSKGVDMKIVFLLSSVLWVLKTSAYQL